MKGPWPRTTDLRVWAARMPDPWRRRLEPIYLTGRRGWQWLDDRIMGPTVTLARMSRLLGRCGLNSGAVVMVHASWNEIMKWSPDLSAVALIRLMQQQVGEEGGILMPTFPFRGREWDYARGEPRFEVQRTPSRVGWLTEVFRRMPGVVRSRHPTHPVAGWGRRAVALLSDHHLGHTYGESSPFFRLQAVDGRVVGLGTGMEPFTIQYVAEYLHPVACREVFAALPVRLSVVDGAKEWLYPLSVTQVWRDYRHLEELEVALLEGGTARRCRAKGLVVVSVGAQDFIQGYGRLLDQGRSFYRLTPPADAAG